jgi:DNA-binding transcriptional LysR family regulator
MTQRSPRLNLNLLKVFDALYQERNVTKAGEVLGITQPAVSHSLTQLRELFEDELFTRKEASMIPTGLALELGDRVHQALQNVYDALSIRSFDPAKSERCFTLATGDNVGTVMAPEIVTAIFARAPKARVRIVPLGSNLVAGLDKNEIDVVINSFSVIPDRMECDLLWQDPPIWMAREGHPALALPIDDVDFTELTYVVVDLGLSQGGTSQDGFTGRDELTQWSRAPEPPEYGANPSPRLQSTSQNRVIVPSFYSAMGIVRQTDFVTLLPRRLAQTVARDLGLRPLLAIDKSRSERKLMALWHREHCKRPAIAWLRNIILEIAREMNESGREDRAQNAPAASERYFTLDELTNDVTLATK